MQPKMIDHVAFWVADRAAVAGELTRRLGLREIDRQDAFTLLGADARRFKLTLFDAEGPRDPGAFVHVALRVNRLPAGGPASFDAGEGLRVVLVERETEADYDLDHVALRASRPGATAVEYERYGFAPAGPGRVEVAGAYVELRPGATGAPERPLLNHLAVLVDSADDAVAEAAELGIEVESVVDAPNTYAAFLTGPDGVRIEYVEHKPSFSLS
ncbi:MAG TPA: VOC family protein [Gaiellaceae bacterium]|nr:VOC family protein [Gaiellaceae bacterium]